MAYSSFRTRVTRCALLNRSLRIHNCTMAVLLRFDRVTNLLPIPYLYSYVYCYRFVDPRENKTIYNEVFRTIQTHSFVQFVHDRILFTARRNFLYEYYVSRELQRGISNTLKNFVPRFEKKNVFRYPRIYIHTYIYI